MNILGFLNYDQAHVLNLIKKYGLKVCSDLYVVGGFVRDCILKEKINDIDICIECNPMKLLSMLPEIKSYTYYEKFQTANVTFKNGISVDLIRCRKESYKENGSLPDIEPASLKDDLERRDFTINAFAYSLKNNNVIDLFHGMDDIKAKRLKKIHQNSYLEDPTRILRAIKYSNRYNLHILDTEEIKNCIKKKAMKSISNDRIANEIKLICMEKCWIEDIVSLSNFKIMNADTKFLGKKSIVRSYNDINVRILNLFYCLVDKNDINIIIENSIFTRKLKLSMKNYINNNKSIISKLSVLKDNYLIYDLLKDLLEYEIVLYSFNDNIKYKILNYFNKLKDLKIYTSGNDIINLTTLKEGKEVGKVLKYLLKLKMNTGIKNDLKFFDDNSGEILNDIKYKDQ